MPTAMPEAPFISTFGSLDGKNLGSINVPSKLGIQSTVPWDISAKRFCEYDESRHSVYLIAAKLLGSSSDPKLPWPSIKGCRVENSCAINTIASYAAPSPCG